MRIIIYDIIRTVARSLPQGFTLAVIISVVFEYIRHKTLNGYISSLENKKNRYFIYLLTYCYMVLYRTLLCRTATYAPLSKVWRDWGIIKCNPLKIDPSPFVGNIALFTILILLILLNFSHKFKNGKDMLIKCTVLSFVLSLSIEVMQLITCRGTFQISDLVYNTLGGFIGSVIYIKFIDKKINT